ncbi:LCP family protein [Staphylococcus simulans]|uniref:LCP family protein n=2 Tax=Staphylococcus simulans TaxID=1286 RepID=UPI000D1FB7DC|nr:LCP family protein [Staphylococcus simulans]MDY5061021.1 LCP family protein [Staphylococcus simulans]PTJ16382.1 LytR family transcriptional regulator [Staphylococcus simulans]
MTNETNNDNYKRSSGEQPLKKRTKKRMRKLPFVILGILILFIIMVVYAVSGYRSGINYAKKHNPNMKVEKFNGPVKNDGKISILLLGADKSDGGKSRTDSIMVAQYDYIHKKMKVVSVMRDTYAKIPGYRDYKINAAYSLGGAELLRKALVENYGINPEYYAVVDFEGFEKMVDELAPNGVPIDVEKDMSELIGVSLKKGQHNLNGKELLGYARFRHDAEGDFGRVRRQQQVIQALKQEMTKPGAIFKLPKVAGILRGYLNTDIPDSALIQTGMNFGIRGDKDVKTLTVPIKGTYQDIQTPESGSALEVDKPANKKAIQDFLNDNSNDSSNKKKEGQN